MSFIREEMTEGLDMEEGSRKKGKIHRSIYHLLQTKKITELRALRGSRNAPSIGGDWILTECPFVCGVRPSHSFYSKCIPVAHVGSFGPELLTQASRGRIFF